MIQFFEKLTTVETFTLIGVTLGIILTTAKLTTMWDNRARFKIVFSPGWFSVLLSKDKDWVGHKFVHGKEIPGIKAQGFDLQGEVNPQFYLEVINLGTEPLIIEKIYFTGFIGTKLVWTRSVERRKVEPKDKTDYSEEESNFKDVNFSRIFAVVVVEITGKKHYKLLKPGWHAKGTEVSTKAGECITPPKTQN